MTTLPQPSTAEILNRGCFCVTLDRDLLAAALDQEVGIKGFAAELDRSHPLLFSNAAVFVPATVMTAMELAVSAIEAAAALPGYQEAALDWAAPLAHRDFGPVGALMGYDFHLASDGPKLIEVNTNAGGAFLNAPLGRAQRACCGPTQSRGSGAADFETEIVGMFLKEWDRQRGSGRPRRIAIVDDAPETQHLLPEFKLAQALLQSQGIETVIGDARDLVFDGRGLSLAGLQVDLVYNRLVDFAFDDPAHTSLRDAYLNDCAVITPNPHVYALLADKRNLSLFSDIEQLRVWGLSASHVEVLGASALRTIRVSDDNADALWEGRRNWFFKPARGHASKAAYRGDKLTRRVWSEIATADYVAQAYAAPSLRNVQRDGAPVELKVDVRLYTYAGKVMLPAARLYQGQTTNMRTPGGGFAPVLVTP